MAGKYFVKSDPNNIQNSNIIPDYIRVKQNILDMWFTIQREYHSYLDRRSNNLDYGSGRIFSLIRSLYFTNLYPLMIKTVKKQTEDSTHKRFVKLMEDSKSKMIQLDEEQISAVIQFLSAYLYEIGLTKVDLDVKPFDQTFEETY